MAQAGPSQDRPSNIRAFPFLHLLSLDFSLDDLSVLTSAQLAISFFHPEYTDDLKRSITKAWRGRREKIRDAILNGNESVGVHASLEERRRDCFVGFEQIDLTSWSIPRDLNTLSSAQLAALPFHAEYNSEIKNRVWNASEIFSSRRERDVQRGLRLQVPDDPVPSRPGPLLESVESAESSSSAVEAAPMASLFDVDEPKVAASYLEPADAPVPSSSPAPAPPPLPLPSTSTSSKHKRSLSPDWRPFIPTERQASLAQKRSTLGLPDPTTSRSTNPIKTIKKTVTYAVKSSSKTLVSSTTRPSSTPATSSLSKPKPKFKSNSTATGTSISKTKKSSSSKTSFPTPRPPGRWDALPSSKPLSPPETPVNVSSTPPTASERNSSIWSNFLRKAAQEYWNETTALEKKEAERLEDEKRRLVTKSENKAVEETEQGLEKPEATPVLESDKMDLEGRASQVDGKENVAVEGRLGIAPVPDVEVDRIIGASEGDVKMEVELDDAPLEEEPMEVSDDEDSTFELDASSGPPHHLPSNTPPSETPEEQTPSESLVEHPVVLDSILPKETTTTDSPSAVTTASPATSLRDPSSTLDETGNAPLVIAGAHLISQSATSDSTPTPLLPPSSPPSIIKSELLADDSLRLLSPPRSISIRRISSSTAAAETTKVVDTKATLAAAKPDSPQAPPPPPLAIRKRKVARPSALDLAELPPEIGSNSVAVGATSRGPIPTIPPPVVNSPKDDSMTQVDPLPATPASPISAPPTQEREILPLPARDAPPHTLPTIAHPREPSPPDIKPSLLQLSSAIPTGPRKTSYNRSAEPRRASPPEAIRVHGPVQSHFVDNWTLLHLAGIPSDMSSAQVWDLLSPPTLPRPLGIKLVERRQASNRLGVYLCWIAYRSEEDADRAKNGLSGVRYRGDAPVLAPTFAIKKKNMPWIWRDMSDAYRDSVVAQSRSQPLPTSTSLKALSTATSPPQNASSSTAPITRSWSPVHGDRSRSTSPRRWGAAPKDTSPSSRRRSKSPPSQPRARSPSHRPGESADHPSSRPSSTNTATIPPRPPSGQVVPAHIVSCFFELCIANIPIASTGRKARDFFPSAVGVALPESSKSPGWLAFVDLVARNEVVDYLSNGQNFPGARNPMKADIRHRPASTPWTWGDLTESFVQQILAGEFPRSQSTLQAPSVVARKRGWSPDVVDDFESDRRPRSLSPAVRRTSASSYSMDNISRSHDRNWTPPAQLPSPRSWGRQHSPSPLHAAAPANNWGIQHPPTADPRRSGRLDPSLGNHPLQTAHFAPSQDQLLALLRNNHSFDSVPPSDLPSPLGAPPLQEQLSSLLASLGNAIPVPTSASQDQSFGLRSQGSLAYDPNERIDLAQAVPVPTMGEMDSVAPSNWGGKEWERERRG